MMAGPHWIDAFVLGVAVCLAACGDRTASGGDARATAELEAWALSASPRVEIGVAEGEDPYQLYDVTSAARLPDGRIVIANNGSREVRFFDADGRFLLQVGGRGDGPGEYRQVDRVRLVPGDTLLVFDGGWGQRRTTAIDPETGEYLGIVDMPTAYLFPSDEWVYDRTLVDSPVRPADRGVVADAVDRLPALGEAEQRYVRVTHEGQLWVTATKFVARDEPVEWRIYDFRGEPLATVSTPAGFTIHDIRGSWVLGEVRDEFDVEYVRLYEIMRPSGPGDEGVLAAAVAAWQGPAVALELMATAQAATGASAIQRLAGAEEEFYGQYERYTLSTDSIRGETGFEPPDEVELIPVMASSRGYMFMAAHREGEWACFLSYGAMAVLGRLPGEIVCGRRAASSF